MLLMLLLILGNAYLLWNRLRRPSDEFDILPPMQIPLKPAISPPLFLLPGLDAFQTYMVLWFMFFGAVLLLILAASLENNNMNEKHSDSNDPLAS
jgi:hypothetical protein